MQEDRGVRDVLDPSHPCPQAAKTANSDVPGNDLLSEASRLLDEHVLENTEDILVTRLR
jgi:hypothetical protein